MTIAEMPTAATLLQEYHWEPQPAAEQLVHGLIAKAVARSPWLGELGERLVAEAGVRLADCVDHIVAGPADCSVESLKAAGFVASPDLGGSFVQPGGIFPAIVLKPDAEVAVRLKVEWADEFVAKVEGSKATGKPGDAVRTVERAGEVIAVERHGNRSAALSAPADAAAVARHAERFQTRCRDWGEDDAAGFEHTSKLVDDAIADLGVDRACDLFFDAERRFWETRNHAARVQKARQDVFGIGWANHDHHTYRSSREHFARLVALWEKLGFVCRERFYAGREAGWGAQVMEQPVAGIVTFNDVDLSPDELMVDFAHDPLPERHALGTVGLWCGLHGESFLQAGMHHLECTFDFAALKEQLEKADVGVMKPFTDFPYLRQAFTKGERWAVPEARIAVLLNRGRITAAQAETFRKDGAIGSHLENLERNQGFKGFNQTGVSEIIAATDPRKQAKG